MEVRGDLCEGGWRVSRSSYQTESIHLSCCHWANRHQTFRKVRSLTFCILQLHLNITSMNQRAINVLSTPSVISAYCICEGSANARWSFGFWKSCIKQFGPHWFLLRALSQTQWETIKVSCHDLFIPGFCRIKSITNTHLQTKTFWLQKFHEISKSKYHNHFWAWGFFKMDWGVLLWWVKILFLWVFILTKNTK